MLNNVSLCFHVSHVTQVCYILTEWWLSTGHLEQFSTDTKTHRLPYHFSTNTHGMSSWKCFYFLYYFARGSGCEVLWWVWLSVGLSVCPRGYLQNHTRDLYQIFLCVLPMSVAGSSSDMTYNVFSGTLNAAQINLIRHVYDGPHRVSPGRGFLPPLKMHYRPGKGGGSA